MTFEPPATRGEPDPLGEWLLWRKQPPGEERGERANKCCGRSTLSHDVSGPHFQLSSRIFVDVDFWIRVYFTVFVFESFLDSGILPRILPQLALVTLVTDPGNASC